MPLYQLSSPKNAPKKRAAAPIQATARIQHTFYTILPLTRKEHNTFRRAVRVLPDKTRRPLLNVLHGNNISRQIWGELRLFRYPVLRAVCAL